MESEHVIDDSFYGVGSDTHDVAISTCILLTSASGRCFHRQNLDAEDAIAVVVVEDNAGADFSDSRIVASVSLRYRASTCGS